MASRTRNIATSSSSSQPRCTRRPDGLSATTTCASTKRIAIGRAVIGLICLDPGARRYAPRCLARRRPEMERLGGGASVGGPEWLEGHFEVLCWWLHWVVGLRLE